MNVKHHVKAARRAARIGVSRASLHSLYQDRGLDHAVMVTLLDEADCVTGDVTLTEHLLRHGFVHVPHPGDPQERRDIIDIRTGETVWSKVDHASVVWPWLAEVAVQRALDKAPK